MQAYRLVMTHFFRGGAKNNSRLPIIFEKYLVHGGSKWMNNNVLSTSGMAFQQFISHLTPKLPKPKAKFIRQLLCGVLFSTDLVLTNVASKVPQTARLTAITKRFRRQLAYRKSYIKHLWSNYLCIRRRRLDINSIFIVDLSDLAIRAAMSLSAWSKAPPWMTWNRTHLIIFGVLGGAVVRVVYVWRPPEGWHALLLCSQTAKIFLWFVHDLCDGTTTYSRNSPYSRIAPKNGQSKVKRFCKIPGDCYNDL